MGRAACIGDLSDLSEATLMRPRIQIIRTPDGYPFAERQPSGAAYVIIGAGLIGLALFVLALLVSG